MYGWGKQGTAIVCIAYVLTVELGLLQPFVDNVVHVAAPHGCRCPRRDLGRVFGQYLSKMLCAFSTTSRISLCTRDSRCEPLYPERHTKGRGAGTGGRMTAVLLAPPV